MRALLSTLLFAVALAGCAGLPEEEGDPEMAPESAEMEDLEPEGPFDATLEDEPGDY